MPNNIYQIDFKKLVVLLLPTRLRKSKTIAWLKVLISPFSTLHLSFSKKRETDLYKLNHNGQVCYLRKVLNDAFDSELRRIKILNPNSYNRQYIYTQAEQKPKFLGVIYARDTSEFSDNGIDFFVQIPREVFEEYKNEIQIGTYRFYEIESLIDFYRLASKKYKIIWT